MINLILGDCLEKLKELPDNSIDSIVTDPPYGLKFMGKKWDYEVPSIDIWKEALRVLKPGGHLLSFGGTRTYHRMVVNIEDAGFEIRDCIQWLYGSGFPKSLNIKEGEFKGWGTALKPANEPIVVARKPLEKGLTVAENVVKYGTGAINIDGSRIEADDQESLAKNWDRQAPAGFGNGMLKGKLQTEGFKENSPSGRWPANIILDEDAAKALDEQSGIIRQRTVLEHGGDFTFNSGGGAKEKQTQKHGKDVYAGASRFFYVAKASKSERGGGNNHPTVKPIKLMQYLINLVTPPNGTVLDPFMGSGSTGVAAKNLNRKFIGIELNEEYFEIAKNRINKLQLELSE